MNNVLCLLRTSMYCSINYASEYISEVLVYEYGNEEFLRRLADPFWFQSFACVIGYDWHSSGITTVTCGALKQALNTKNLGIKIAGGKGKTLRKTIEEIENTDFNLSTNKIKRLNNFYP